MEAQGGEGKDALYIPLIYESVFLSPYGWGTVLLISVYEEVRRTTRLPSRETPFLLHFFSD
jgi:hypothetical protein